MGFGWKKRGFDELGAWTVVAGVVLAGILGILLLLLLLLLDVVVVVVVAVPGPRFFVDVVLVVPGNKCLFLQNLGAGFQWSSPY